MQQIAEKLKKEMHQFESRFSTSGRHYCAKPLRLSGGGCTTKPYNLFQGLIIPYPDTWYYSNFTSHLHSLGKNGVSVSSKHWGGSFFPMAQLVMNR